MNYTISQLAKLARVSTRTLHHYDEINLLKPAVVKANGYRIYKLDELLRLQQILFFRELEFSLEEIKGILSAPQFNLIDTLQSQQKMLKIKKDRLEAMIKTISNTINVMKKKQKIKEEQLFKSLDTKQIKAYQKEAKERWGNATAWKQSQERTKNWNPKDYERVQKEAQTILLTIVEVMDGGFESDEVQAQIANYHQHMNQFYDCSYQMFGNLGEMYSQDERFRAYYEKIQPGLAEFMTRAICFYVKLNKKQV